MTKTVNGFKTENYKNWKLKTGKGKKLEINNEEIYFEDLGH